MKKFLFSFLFVAAAAIARADSGKQLLYGRLLSASDTGILISCDPAKHTHPTGYYGIGDSRDRLVFVTGNPAVLRKLGEIGRLWMKPAPQKEDLIAIVAVESGDYTYTTVMGARNTVRNFVQAEQVPSFSAVTPFDPTKPQTPPGPSRSQFGTVMDTPRYNL